MTNEQHIIERIRTMTDAVEVEKQLEVVRKAYQEVTSHVRSEMSDIRKRLNLSFLSTEEDLDDELKQLQPATDLQMTLVRYEKELVNRLQELKEKK
jgi:hypothetical protein